MTCALIPQFAAAVVILMVVGILVVSFAFISFEYFLNRYQVYIISHFRDKRRKLTQSVWKRLRQLREQQQKEQQQPQQQSHPQQRSRAHTPVPQL